MIQLHFFRHSLAFLATILFLLLPLKTSHAQAGSESTFDAVQFLTQTVPSKLEPGQTANIDIKIKNVGTTAWSNKAGYRLVIAAAGPGLSYDAERIELGADELIAPGDIKTFSISITAPNTPSSYPFEWYLYRNAERIHKDVLTKASITVVDPLNRSQFVSQLVPDKIEPDSERRVIIQFKNAGKTSWSAKNGYRLTLINSPKVWGLTNVEQSEPIVLPGEVATFIFTLRAPAQKGNYNIQSQMHSDNVAFGEQSPPVIITVSHLAAHALQAAFISQAVPKVLTAGETYEVKVVMKNTGNTVWTTNDYKLGIKNPDDSLIWLINQVELSQSDVIRPGQSKQFIFNIRAPDESGSYTFQWQMLSDKHGYFGARSEPINVTVKSKNTGR